jgi:hypothetical protein
MLNTQAAPTIERFCVNSIMTTPFLINEFLTGIPRIPGRCEARIVPSSVLNNGKSRAAARQAVEAAN